MGPNCPCELVNSAFHNYKNRTENGSDGALQAHTAYTTKMDKHTDADIESMSACLFQHDASSHSCSLTMPE